MKKAVSISNDVVGPVMNGPSGSFTAAGKLCSTDCGFGNTWALARISFHGLSSLTK